MRLIKILIFILALNTSTCFARISIDASQPDESGLIEAAVKILECCYVNRVTSLGLAGNFTETISRKLWSRGRFSVTLVDARIVDSDQVPPQFRHKLQLFVVVTSSSLNVSKTLREIKASIWWNHMAAFLILDWPLSNHGCSNTFEILMAAWEMNILNAKLMCYHWKNALTIYSFNPFTSQAPDPWKLDKTYRGKNNHPWTLFTRGYENDEDVCNELDFEKTNDLGGYEIRVSVLDITYGGDPTKSNDGCAGTFASIYCKTLLPPMKATPKMLLHSSVNDMGSLDEQGNPHGILAEVISGSSDIAFTSRFYSGIPNLTSAYPDWSTDITCLTHYSGTKSQLSKIISVLDVNSRIGLFVVSLITILFFHYFLNLTATITFLDTLRLICNASLPQVPTRIALRIYLGSLFLFVLTMQGIYQGKLASLLTKEEPLRNVNTMTDLVELGHTIYNTVAYRAYFNDSEFDGRVVVVKGVDCTEHVLHNPRAACIGTKILIMYAAAKFKLHMSSGSLSPTYFTLPIRPDWPLEERVNTLLMRSLQTHVIKHLTETEIYTTYRRIQSQKNEIYDQSVKILNLKQLGFAFVILAIGLGFATVSFGIEVTLWRVRPQNARTPNRFLSSKLIRNYVKQIIFT